MLVPFFLFARWLEGKEADVDEDTLIVKPLTFVNAPVSGVALFCIISLLPIIVWGRLVFNEPSAVSIDLPRLAGWQGPSGQSSDWTPKFRGADGEILVTYKRSGRSLEVYVNWYRSQSQGRELIGYGNSLAGNNARRHYDRIIIDLTGGNAAKLPKIREILASSSGGGRRLIWYYYVVGDQVETSALRAKLRQGLRSIAGKGGTGLISVSAACEREDTDCATARQLLKNEFGDIEKTIRKTLAALDAA